MCKSLFAPGVDYALTAAQGQPKLSLEVMMTQCRTYLSIAAKSHTIVYFLLLPAESSYIRSIFVQANDGH